MNHDAFLVQPGKKIKLDDFDPSHTGDFKNKQDAQSVLEEDMQRLGQYQDVLYAQDQYALLIVLQAMDAAGKDGVIKHVMSGVNPQGCEVFNFKAPSGEELNHDYLWRCMKALPERGRIGIFNRSYYEEVLVVRVHPNLLDSQKLPSEVREKNLWQNRFEDISHFEQYLDRNGIVVLKFFLNVSRKEQKARFLERINTPEKNWKFSFADTQEREHWDKYMVAYEDMFNHTSTARAPWYIIPADHKWFTRVAVADIIVSKLRSLNLRYPEMSKERKRDLEKAKQMLEAG
jgi:PPK2 family polyphosphate:nucleotide phosphotransferase